MIRRLQEHPGLVLLAGAWFLPVIVSALRVPLLEQALRAETILLVIACVGCLGIGLFIGRRRTVGPAVGRSVVDVSDGLVLMLAVFCAGAGALAYFTQGSSSLVSLEETRNLHRAGLTVQSRIGSYVYQLCGAGSIIATALAVRVRTPVKTMVVVVAVTFLGWLGFIRATGSRGYIMVVFAVAVCGILWRFPRQLISVRGLLYSVAIGAPVFLANVLFVVSRMESLLADPAINARIMQRASDLVQRQTSSVWEQDLWVLSSWLLLEYGSDPLFYLDYFLSIETPPVCYGLHQFSVVANQIPLYDYVGQKELIDGLYEPLGVYWNVWGTAVRDAVIDFGRFGACLFFAVIGWLSGWSKGMAHSLRSAGVLHVLTLVWLLYTPFYSPFLLRPFQVAFGIGIVWVVWERLSGRSRVRGIDSKVRAGLGGGTAAGQRQELKGVQPR